MDYNVHSYAESELAYKEFLRPSLQQAIDLLSIPENSLVLDAGCGPGSLFTFFSNKIKPPGHITGIDASTPHLEAAKQVIIKNELEEIVSLQQVDLFRELPFPDNYFDIVWLSDVLSPDDFGEEILPTLKKMYRVIKPGGKIAVFYGNWLRLHLLPGYSILEHTISIANEKRKSTEFSWKPEMHPENCLDWLNSCNFRNAEHYYLSSTYKAPIPDHVKNYVHYHLTHIYSTALQFKSPGLQISQRLVEEFNSITDKNSTRYILNKPSYHCAAHALFVTGQKPEG